MAVLEPDESPRFKPIQYDINPDLTLAQQFELRRMVDASQSMSKEQALELLVNASRLLMIKTNVLIELSNQGSSYD